MKRFRIITRIVGVKTPNPETGGSWVEPQRRWVVQQKGWFWWSDATSYTIESASERFKTEYVSTTAVYKSLKKAEEQVEHLTALYKPDTVVKEYDVFDTTKQQRIEVVQDELPAELIL